MKKKAINITHTSAHTEKEKALSVKSEEANKSYINDLKEIDQIFEPIVKGKSISISIDAKSKDSLKWFAF